MLAFAQCVTTASISLLAITSHYWPLLAITSHSTDQKIITLYIKSKHKENATWMDAVDMHCCTVFANTCWSKHCLYG